MPTTRVPAYRCGADLSGWFMTARPIVEDDGFTGWSALVIVHLSSRFANTQQRSLLKTVDPTSSKNLVPHLLVTLATVVQNE